VNDLDEDNGSVRRFQIRSSGSVNDLVDEIDDDQIGHAGCREDDCNVELDVGTCTASLDPSQRAGKLREAPSVIRVAEALQTWSLS